ncbi:G5 domain-containing protein [Pilimelia terevasa]|uniref:G5 domain-containing protein n=1 Tax=Pilimelia terevasa TaxID=53372 RepID=UPI00166CD75F|nr:G5 domain-containing protein [Pilimelia terevasa]
MTSACEPRTAEEAAAGRVDTLSSAAAADATPPPDPSPPASTPTASPSPTPTPTAATRLVNVRRGVPFARRTVSDPSAAAGSRRVRTEGVRGTAVLTYRVRYSGGRAGTRVLVRRVVVRQPVTEVVAVGTRAAMSCDPNYAGACVPVARDVDCRGGSGDGPAYVSGPVRVVGNDIYGLDRDGDGTGCDSS